MSMFQFFPSTPISLYMARLFLLRSFAILLLLVLVLLALDLLGESGKILNYPGNGQAQIWEYITLRAPQIISRFLPFSVLLGTLVTFLTLNQNSEIIAMKAAGLSAHQILAPMIIASLGVAALTFAFNDRVTAPTTAQLTAWSNNDFGPIPRESGIKSDVWARAGENLFHAALVQGSGKATKLTGINVYIRSNSKLVAIYEAKNATYSESGWRLSQVSKFDVASALKTPVDDLVIGTELTPDRFTLAKVDPNALSMSELGDAISKLKAAGRQTAELEANWWHKLSGPLSSVLMPLLGAVAAFGLARSGQLFLRAIAGMALGFAYFVVDNFALAMGGLGAYPPLIAAWAPFGLFLLIGETVLIRTEE